MAYDKSNKKKKEVVRTTDNGISRAGFLKRLGMLGAIPLVPPVLLQAIENELPPIEVKQEATIEWHTTSESFFEPTLGDIWFFKDGKPIAVTRDYSISTPPMLDVTRCGDTYREFIPNKSYYILCCDFKKENIKNRAGFNFDSEIEFVYMDTDYKFYGQGYLTAINMNYDVGYSVELKTSGCITLELEHGN